MERRGNTTYVKVKWEKERGMNISEDEWLYIWKKSLSTVQPCWRQCGVINVDHSHVSWLCPEVVQLWENVIVKILGYDILY